MGISIKVGSNKVNQSVEYIDREIIGLIISSNSGYDYPQVIESYDSLTTIFSDYLDTDLRRYKQLFEYGYMLAPVKLSSIDNNYANIVFTSDPVVKSYYTVVGESYTSDITYSKPEKVTKSGYTNHLVIQLPDNYVNEDFIILPKYDNGQWKRGIIWFRDRASTVNPSINLDSIKSVEKRVDLDNSKSKEHITNLVIKHIKKYFNLHAEVDSKGRLIIHSESQFPITNYIRLGGKRIKAEISDIMTNKIYGYLTTNKDWIKIRSIIPGDFGKGIHVQLNVDSGRLLVKSKGKLVETWEFGHISNLQNLTMSSKYIRVDIPDHKLDVTGDFSGYLKGNLDDVGRESGLMNALDTFVDEDVDIDIFMYDHNTTDYQILRKLDELAKVKSMTVVCNVSELSVEYSSDNLIYILGTHNNGIPNVYLFLGLLKSTLVGQVDSDIILDRYLTNSEKYLCNLNKINYIESDNYKYYVNYFRGNYERRNIIYKITRTRIHRRFFSLKEVLGTTLSDVKDRILVILSNIRTDIPMIEYVNLDECKLSNSGSECIVRLVYKLPEIREEVLTLNITLNTTQ